MPAGLAHPPAEFEDFFKSQYPRLLRFMILMGASHDEAEDAVAEALVQVLKNWVTIGSPVRYAHTVAYNSFRKTRLRSRQEQERELLAAGPVAGSVDESSALSLTAVEDAEWVADLLRILPPVQRRVMELVVTGYTAREISRLLEQDESVVRSNLRHARTKMKAVVETRRRSSTSDPTPHAKG